MKLLIITNLYPNSEEPTRGVFNKQQFGELAKLCELRVVAPLPWFPRTRFTRRWHRFGRIPNNEVIDGIKVSHPRYLVIPKIMRVLYGLFFFLGIKREVARVKKEFDFDAILATWAYPDGFGASLIAWLFKVPLVIKVHGSDINLHMEPLTRRWLTLWGLRAAQRVIAVSVPLKEKIAALGVDADKIDVIANGVDIELFKPRDQHECRDILHVPQDKKAILFIGHLVPVKGIEHLIDGASLLPQDFHLVVMGDGFLEDTLKKRVEEYGFTHKVQFVAPRPHDEIPIWMNACDVFCLPSLNEGCPNVVLEALACGRPIVASRVGGIPQIITHEKNGLLVEPGRPLALAHAIEKALHEDQLFQYDPDFIANMCWLRSAENIFASLEAAESGYVQYSCIARSKCGMKRYLAYMLPSRVLMIRGKRDAGTSAVALTFDDGPHPEYTPQILDILQKYNARATFFLLGEEIEKYPDLARRIAAEGHAIGNHTYDHRRFKELSKEDAVEQVAKTQGICRDILGVTPTIFRPPRGVVRFDMFCAMRTLKLATVLWSVGSRDWKKESSALIARHVNPSAVRSGDIILLHDDNPFTVEALPVILEQLGSAGFGFVTVEEFL